MKTARFDESNEVRAKTLSSEPVLKSVGTNVTFGGRPPRYRASFAFLSFWTFGRSTSKTRSLSIRGRR
jgi:hypothetical protein